MCAQERVAKQTSGGGSGRGSIRRTVVDEGAAPLPRGRCHRKGEVLAPPAGNPATNLTGFLTTCCRTPPCCYVLRRSVTLTLRQPRSLPTHGKAEPSARGDRVVPDLTPCAIDFAVTPPIAGAPQRRVLTGQCTSDFALPMSESSHLASSGC